MTALQTREPISLSGRSQPSGRVELAVYRPRQPSPLQRWGRKTLWHAKNFFKQGWRELPLRLSLPCLPVAKRLIPGLNVSYSKCYGQVVRNRPAVPDNWQFIGLHGTDLLYDVLDDFDNVVGEETISLSDPRAVSTWVEDLGLLGCHLVTTAGKAFLCSAMAGAATTSNLKFHGFGTGSTSPAAGDTTLTTELTTQYAVSNTRPTGSQAHSSNTYTTIGTIAPSTSVGLQEWGLFDQASNAGGTILDHQTYSVINLTNVDSLALTYVFTQS